MFGRLEGGDVGVADVVGSDRTEEDFIDSTDEELFQCLVGVVVLFEDFLGFVMCSVDGGHLRGCCGGGDCRGGTGVGRRNKESGR